MHKPLWDGVIKSLHDIFIERWPADKVIQRQMKAHRKWGSKDRRLFAESVYDLVRWWRKILFAAGVDWPEVDRWIDANPQVFESALSTWMQLHGVEPGKGVTLTKISNDAKSVWNDATLPRAVRESIPNWLDQWGAEELGAKWDEVLPCLNSVAPVYLRANRIKTKPQDLERALLQESITARTVEADALVLEKRSNIFTSKAFQKGLFEVQDLNSQRVSSMLNVESGQRVIDACAGAGGKSLHLASLMGNKGKIIAMDVVEAKLGQLRERASRAGASCIETRLIEGTKTIKRLEESADRLLLDVPCSGLGVIRRNPDAKWKLGPEEIARLKGLQREILSRYSRMLKKGGQMVYATCSIMPSENHLWVREFLSQSESEFELTQDQTLYPMPDSGDGFYIARLIRKS